MSPQPRIFVVQVTADGADGKTLLGYAITEQVGFIDVAAPDSTPDLTRQAGFFREGLEALFRKLDGMVFRAIGIPAARDPRGGGYQMFTSAGGGHGGGGGPH